MVSATKKRAARPEPKGLSREFRYGGDITVNAVTSFMDVRRFVRFPWAVYRGNPNWVPPIKFERKWVISAKKNPLFHCGEGDFFIARKDGEISGTIAVFVNDAFNRVQRERTAFFGYFEAVDDPEVVRALISTAGSWARDRGMETLRGPADVIANEKCGLLVEGFDMLPAVYMNYNPPYYGALLEGAGLTKTVDLYAYEVSAIDFSEDGASGFDRIKRASEIVRKKYDIDIRNIRLLKFRDEIDHVKEVYNTAWAQNWGFTPLADREFDHLVKALWLVLVPDLCVFAEINGEVAGFLLGVPDVNPVIKKLNGRLFPFGLLRILIAKSRVKRMRVIALGVTEEFRGSGVEAALIERVIERANARDYTSAELSWVAEGQTSIINLLEGIGAERIKRYRMYEMYL
ncbi:MAG: GNAT family N-acetyltransferase [bacterium]|nr:GNAT family N-acetyltransferase [bacterium]